MARRRRAFSRDRERVAASAFAQEHARATPALHASRGPAALLLRLHRDFGNRGVQRMLRGPSPRRACACGGGCAACRAKESAGHTEPRAARLGLDEAAATRAYALERQSGKGTALPAKGASAESVEETDEAKPNPKNGSATIQCDGSGSYEIIYGSWENATCGTKDCVTKHEGSHMKDWKAKWPNGCKNQPRGYLPKGDPPDEVLMTAAEYNAFLKQSECTAHTVDLACANALTPTEACKQTVKDYIKLTADQKKNYC